MRSSILKRLGTSAVVLAVAVGPVAAQQGRWISGYGQGTIIARVENAADGGLYVCCREGWEDRTLGIRYTSSAAPGPAGAAATVRYGFGEDWSEIPATWDASPALTHEAVEPGDRARLANLIGMLAAFGSVTVTTPDRQDTFSLAGSRAALDGLAEPCR